MSQIKLIIRESYMKRHLLGIVLSALVFCLSAGIESRTRRIFHHSCYVLVLPVVKTAAGIMSEEDAAIRLIVSLIRVVIK